MQASTYAREDLLAAIQDSVQEILSIVSPLSEAQMNQVPFAGSWTAAQLLNHVTKSTNGIDKVLETETIQPGRAPDEKVEELRKIFLDFTTKMESPEFIVPDAGPFEKTVVTGALHTSFQQLARSAAGIDLNGITSGTPLGEITKLELLHFVLFHTQRHLHQLKKITGAVS